MACKTTPKKAPMKSSPMKKGSTCKPWKKWC
jgi:hypothetical protein